MRLKKVKLLLIGGLAIQAEPGLKSSSSDLSLGSFPHSFVSQEASKHISPSYPMKL